MNASGCGATVKDYGHLLKTIRFRLSLPGEIAKFAL